MSLRQSVKHYLLEGLGAGLERPVPVPHVGAGDTLEAVQGGVDEHIGSVRASVLITIYGAHVDEEVTATLGDHQAGREELDHCGVVAGFHREAMRALPVPLNDPGVVLLELEGQGTAGPVDRGGHKAEALPGPHGWG